jgi:ABC-type sugar transport system ATPase subunit
LTRKGIFEDISLQLRRGEILVFAGLVGAGRTEVAGVIFDLDRADADEIRIDNERVNISSPKVAMRHDLAYVPIYLSLHLLQECV